METNRFPLILALLAIFFSCSAPSVSTGELEKVEREIIETETAFSNYSEKNGFAKAIAEYSAENVIKLNPQNYATFGKTQL